MGGTQSEDPFEGHGVKKIAEREDDYHKGRLRRRELSPEREDPFASAFGSKTNGATALQQA